jgi:hypothetical protein
VVPLRYAVIVVFDKAWTRYANDIGLRDGTHIFACKDAGLSAALDCLESLDVSKFVVIEDPDDITT